MHEGLVRRDDVALGLGVGTGNVLDTCEVGILDVHKVRGIFLL